MGGEKGVKKGRRRVMIIFKNSEIRTIITVQFSSVTQ